MALTNRNTDTYSATNYILSAIAPRMPANMTMVPEFEQSKLLPKLAPSTVGDMTVISPVTGAPMTMAPGSEVLRTNKSTNPAQYISALFSGSDTDTSQEDTLVVKPRLGSSGGKAFDVWRRIHGRTGETDEEIKKDYEDYIRNAGYAKVGAAALDVIGGISDGLTATKHRRDVEATKTQYETQKKIIDTNINNTESTLLENLRENMANLDVMTAAKNVDIASQAIVGDKAKGAMDLGRDVANMRTQGALQKAAMDLEYAINVRRAKQDEISSWLNAGFSAGKAALSLL